MASTDKTETDNKSSVKLNIEDKTKIFKNGVVKVDSGLSELAEVLQHINGGTGGIAPGITALKDKQADVNAVSSPSDLKIIGRDGATGYSVQDKLERDIAARFKLITSDNPNYGMYHKLEVAAQNAYIGSEIPEMLKSLSLLVTDICYGSFFNGADTTNKEFNVYKSGILVDDPHVIDRVLSVINPNNGNRTSVGRTFKNIDFQATLLSQQDGYSFVRLVSNKRVLIDLYVKYVLKNIKAKKERKPENKEKYLDEKTKRMMSAGKDSITLNRVSKVESANTITVPKDAACIAAIFEYLTEVVPGRFDANKLKDDKICMFSYLPARVIHALPRTMLKEVPMNETGVNTATNTTPEGAINPNGLIDNTENEVIVNAEKTKYQKEVDRFKACMEFKERNPHIGSNTIAYEEAELYEYSTESFEAFCARMLTHSSMEFKSYHTTESAKLNQMEKITCESDHIFAVGTGSTSYSLEQGQSILKELHLNLEYYNDKVSQGLESLSVDIESIADSFGYVCESKEVLHDDIKREANSEHISSMYYHDLYSLDTSAIIAKLESNISYTIEKAIGIESTILDGNGDIQLAPRRLSAIERLVEAIVFPTTINRSMMSNESVLDFTSNVAVGDEINSHNSMFNRDIATEMVGIVTKFNSNQIPEVDNTVVSSTEASLVDISNNNATNAPTKVTVDNTGIAVSGTKELTDEEIEERHGISGLSVTGGKTGSIKRGTVRTTINSAKTSKLVDLNAVEKMFSNIVGVNIELLDNLRLLPSMTGDMNNGAIYIERSHTEVSHLMATRGSMTKMTSGASSYGPMQLQSYGDNKIDEENYGNILSNLVFSDAIKPMLTRNMSSKFLKDNADIMYTLKKLLEENDVSNQSSNTTGLNDMGYFNLSKVNFIPAAELVMFANGDGLGVSTFNKAFVPANAYILGREALLSYILVDSKGFCILEVPKGLSDLPGEYGGGGLERSIRDNMTTRMSLKQGSTDNLQLSKRFVIMGATEGEAGRITMTDIKPPDFHIDPDILRGWKEEATSAVGYPSSLYTNSEGGGIELARKIESMNASITLDITAAQESKRESSNELATKILRLRGGKQYNDYTVEWIPPTPSRSSSIIKKELLMERLDAVDAYSDIFGKLIKNEKDGDGLGPYIMEQLDRKSVV